MLTGSKSCHMEREYVERSETTRLFGIFGYRAAMATFKSASIFPLAVLGCHKKVRRVGIRHTRAPVAWPSVCLTRGENFG